MWAADADLLAYALAHVKNGGQPIGLPFLTTTFHQPFGDLQASCETVTRQVCQVRLCIETLRRYLQARPPTAAQQTALATAERSYRLAAYTALLSQIGTSYEEIRLARGAAQAQRDALAGRLGIPANGLNALFLDSSATPDAITEAKLEQLFGLVNTARNPLTAGPVPVLQTLRLQQLRTTWREQDFPTDWPAPETPIVDPDLVGPTDFKNAVASDPAFGVWRARRTFVDTKLAGFRTQREQAGTNVRAGLDAILSSGLGKSSNDLKVLADLRANGQDISPQLEPLALANDAFNYLVRIRSLLDAQAPVTNAEWDDVYSILAQVQKRRQFAAWRQEEKTKKVILGPDHFAIPEPPPLQFPPPEPTPLQAWRASVEARRAWHDTLRTRIDQERAVVDAVRSAVGAAEEATLPMLRDALILATDAPGADPAAKARWLNERLLVDAQMAGSVSTTRGGQAIETLQGLLYGLRTDQVRDTLPNLTLQADDFDAEWDWLGRSSPGAPLCSPSSTQRTSSHSPSRRRHLHRPRLPPGHRRLRAADSGLGHPAGRHGRAGRARSSRA